MSIAVDHCSSVVRSWQILCRDDNDNCCVGESNYSEYQSREQRYGFKGGPIVVGRSKGEEWWELCLLSLEELLNLELFVCLC